MALLAQQVSEAGWPVFRFDRSGVGDSTGIDGGFRSAGPDIVAAAAAFRETCSEMTHMIGLGLCDGASALAFHGTAAEVDGLILLNPWVVESQGDTPPPAAIRAHYRDRLLTLAGWQKLLTRGFNPKALIRGIGAAIKTPDQDLARDVMTALASLDRPVHILLAERDDTARAFIDQYKGPAGATLRHAKHVQVFTRDTASHSFAGAEDHAWLVAQVLKILDSRS